jgi:GDP/UDP-N,N'-diacetylbacillosamine 2-epimerase (hydrolysing)
MIVRKRNICVVTGTRAEYGLLFWLMKEIKVSEELELHLIVTGAHLSPEFGLTCRHIEQDGFSIDKKVEMLLSSDSEVGITKSMGLGMIGFADALEDIKPDLLVVLGDRFEIFSAASAATIARIPIAHLHGGETTEGAFDESFRHSITKMSHLHFTATEEYRNRVIQLGEQPNSVFNYGAIGVDNIKRLVLLSREEFEKSIDFKLNEKNLLVTFHPVTLENNTAEEQFQSLLNALDKLNDTHVIFTKANADPKGRLINNMIEQYVENHSRTTCVVTSLGQLRYFSAMQYVDCTVGNSSSGLIEAPSLNVATVNIGSRQKGRIMAKSVICCKPTEEGISHAIHCVYLDSFQDALTTVENPYSQRNTVGKIVKKLSKCSLDNILIKRFYDQSIKESHESKK